LPIYGNQKHDKRKPGRPKITWKRTFEDDLETSNVTLDVVQEIDEVRDEWKSLVCPLCHSALEELNLKKIMLK